jgi:hypothetical protein
MGYYVCFQRVVRWLVDNVASKLGLPVDFTFDQRPVSEYNAGALYGLMREDPDWRSSIFMGRTVSFTSRDNPRIQMADLVARETMKSLDNEIGPTPRPPRKSMLALCDEGHLKIESIGRPFWEALKARASGAEQMSVEYRAWLKERRLRDNWTNRHGFLGFLQAQGRVSDAQPPIGPLMNAAD